jgi:hypothetical protein
LCLTALALPLSGCFLPPVVSIASLALDVGSYAVSGKTMTDHGISLVADEDCALVRVFEGEVCEDHQQYEFETVAVLEPLPTDEGAMQFAALPTAEDDPLAVRPLGRDDLPLVAYDKGSDVAALPYGADDSALDSPLTMQFARMPEESILMRDTR